VSVVAQAYNSVFRYMEAVQGKELERMFREEGVIDEDDEEEPKPQVEPKTVSQHETPDGTSLAPPEHS